MSAENNELDIKMRIPVAYWEQARSKQIVSLNNTARWHRYGKTKIKNQYKEILTSFYIREPTECYRKANITFKILRHNKRKIDPDALSWVYKWFIDAFTEAGWLVDDDQITYTLVPATYIEGLNETMVDVSIKCFDKVEQ
jgi:Holliday junction resolvase RusA-like endonuclease